MTKSYVGIITRRGLESLWPETEHALPFLLRRLQRRQRPRALACWAVMSEPDAAEVARHLFCQRYADALVTLNTQAAFLGSILPSRDDQTESEYVA